MSRTPLDRLRARIAETGAPLCLGIDPHPDRLPEGLPRDATGLEAFARGLLEACADHIAAVKLNLAFFEAYGAAGWSALEAVRREVPADLIVILDGKRGDIGSSAERYAAALFGVLEADAVTVSPYLGEDAIEPFLAWDDRLVYVLARTSNPSASRVQDLSAGDEPLHLRVARWVADSWRGGRVGLVVGATAPAELEHLRAALPGPAFLVPGVGAQGGDLIAAAQSCHGTWAPGLVAVSRAIAGASRGADWGSAAASAAAAVRADLAEAVLHSTSIAASAAANGGS